MNGMGSYQFEWIPFYKEVAREMLSYKQNRKDMLKWIYEKIMNSLSLISMIRIKKD